MTVNVPFPPTESRLVMALSLASERSIDRLDGISADDDAWKAFSVVVNGSALCFQGGSLTGFDFVTRKSK
jgi:hypothetical protein